MSDQARYLAGRHAVVTGGGRGIGAAVAAELARLGASVTIMGRDVASLERHGATLAATHGARVFTVACDVADERSVERAFGAAREAHGDPYVLVNNAGQGQSEPLVQTTRETWDRLIAVNLTGTFLCTQHVARAMVAQGRGGSIIVIVSTAGHQGQTGNIGYCTSKSGLLNFTRAAAMDLAKHRIRVNSLTPTATDVEEGIERAVEWGRPRLDRGGRLLDFAKMIPARTLPSPRHYARAAVFLASDDAEMITGIDLRVDAGAIAKYWPWVPNA